jgi:hypothetical protein
MDRVNPPFFEKYIWNGMSGLGGIKSFQGLDKKSWHPSFFG